MQEPWRKGKVRVKGRYKTRRLGAGPGVAGSAAEFRDFGGRLRSRFGGPEAKKGRWKMLDLSATLINSWPPDCNVFLVFSRVPIWPCAVAACTFSLSLEFYSCSRLPLIRVPVCHSSFAASLFIINLIVKCARGTVCRSFVYPCATHRLPLDF